MPSKDTLSPLPMLADANVIAPPVPIRSGTGELAAALAATTATFAAGRRPAGTVPTADTVPPELSLADPPKLTVLPCNRADGV
jgi:hypothetical protein